MPKSKRRKQRELLVEHLSMHITHEASNQYNLKTLKNMEEASNHTPLLPWNSRRRNSCQPMPTSGLVSPINKLTLQHEGSALYDTFELRALTRQLNKAIHGSNVSSPPYIRHLNSPLYRLQLDRIYREGAKTPRRISCPQSTNAVVDKRTGGMKYAGVDTGGFVTRLWKKVKQGLLRNNQRKEGSPD